MNEKVIWDFIYSRCNNPYGTAALMGNLMAESSLNPKCVTGSSDPDYTSKADAGTINFANDGKAYGLVQWCYHSRKEGLITYARSIAASVGAIYVQLDYMWHELQTSYKTAYNAIMSATNIREASDVIMLKYEKPANTSETMRQRRANYGQKYFDEFWGGAPVEPSKKQVVISIDRVNIRAGNGKNYTRLAMANKGATYDYVATSDDGWYAIKLPNKVGWVSSEFSSVK